jgi:hypothetical protein
MEYTGRSLCPYGSQALLSVNMAEIRITWQILVRATHAEFEENLFNGSYRGIDNQT